MEEKIKKDTLSFMNLLKFKTSDGKTYIDKQYTLTIINVIIDMLNEYGYNDYIKDHYQKVKQVVENYNQ